MAKRPIGDVFTDLEDNFAAIEESYEYEGSAGFRFGMVRPPRETQEKMAEQIVEETEYDNVFELAGPGGSGTTFAVFDDDEVPKRTKSLVREVFTID